ncbi:zf-HC2 domain-containing protein [Dactylosporangium cerinum]|uniref:Zf-HC2 domain-containing protein n=1 Tax=Dactylosporangium cerinum TaxID=1434730 RepID=A0ABV9W6L5_9ACTN
MAPDVHPDDLLGAYVMDACAGTDAAAVAAHLAGCPGCAAEADRLRTAAEWVGELADRRPPPELRARVLAAARAARPPCDAEIEGLLAPYVAQVAAFDRLLGGLAGPLWLRPVGPHASVRALVTHLRANDTMVAAATGAGDRIVRRGRPDESTVDVRRRWRSQADELVRTVAAAEPPALDRPAPLAGRAPAWRPLREALTQRVFETWIHADDVRTLLALPPEPPPPRQLRRIADFALRLLPAAMDAAGRGRPHQVLRLTLTGPGGGERLVALSAATPTTGSTVVAEVTVAAELFCRLVAGRVGTLPAGVSVGGDPRAAADFLGVAATMGCD